MVDQLPLYFSHFQPDAEFPVDAVSVTVAPEQYLVVPVIDVGAAAAVICDIVLLATSM